MNRSVTLTTASCEFEGEDMAGKEADESEADEEKESGSTRSIRLPSLKLQVVVG
jgi:hypothetical protein